MSQHRFVAAAGRARGISVALGYPPVCWFVAELYAMPLACSTSGAGCGGFSSDLPFIHVGLSWLGVQRLFFGHFASGLLACQFPLASTSALYAAGPCCAAAGSFPCDFCGIEALFRRFRGPFLGHTHRPKCNACAPHRKVPLGSRFFLLWLGFCNYPVRVWAAPKGWTEGISAVNEFVEHASSLAPEPLDEGGWSLLGDSPIRGSVPRPVEGSVLAASEEAFSNDPGSIGPCTETDPTDEGVVAPPSCEPDTGHHAAPSAAEHCHILAFLAAPGYRLVRVEGDLSLPASISAVESMVRAQAADLLEECGEQIVPVFPQTTPGVAAFVAAPTWFAEERLVVALLDASAIRGNVFAVVLSFPTCVEEIRRVAGFSSVLRHDVFVAGRPAPSHPGADIEATDGALIQLVPPGHTPFWAAPLAFALWHPHYWPSAAPVPRTRDSACALILHKSGKYLFDRFTTDEWANRKGIADLISTPLTYLRMQAANPAEMLPYVYRGSPVRGVIAVIDRDTDRDDEDRPLPYIVFLDSRPLGFDFNFQVSETLFLPNAWLLAYLQQPPPPGWKLVTKGGSRTDDGVSFFPGEVLILAFQRVQHQEEEHPESEEDFSPDPDDAEDGDEAGSDSSTSEVDSSIGVSF